LSRGARRKEPKGDWKNAVEHQLHVSDEFRTLDNDDAHFALREGEGKSFKFIKLAGTLRKPQTSHPEQIKFKFSHFIPPDFTATILRSILNKRQRISRPPGSSLSSLAECVFSKKTFEHVVTPIISDLQVEYCDALAANRKIKAAWVRLRGYWSLFKALGLYSILKMFVDAWRKISSV
jgi:hypothetical protein